MNDDQQAVRQVLDAYGAAVYAKDVAGFVALYAPDMVVFDMWGVWAYNGVAAWHGMVTEWFGSLGSERVLVEAHDVEVMADGNLAAMHAFVTIKGLSAAGEELRAMQNRYSWVLRRMAGEWKIVHEHSSAPLDFETSTAILRHQ